MMDWFGIIHYIVVKNEQVVNSELIFNRSLVGKDLLGRLKHKRKDWIDVDEHPKVKS